MDLWNQSVDCGVRSVKRRVWILKCKGGKFGVGSIKSGVQSIKCGV